MPWLIPVGALLLWPSSVWLGMLAALALLGIGFLVLVLVHLVTDPPALRIGGPDRAA